MFEYSGAHLVNQDNPPELLTEREQQILQALADGLSNEEIGAQFWLSADTVKWHLNEIFDKLLVGGRAEAVVRGRKLGLLRTKTFSLLPMLAALLPV